METSQVISVERIRAGVVIEFDDGRCALYSASLLLSIYPDAIPMDGADEGEDVEDEQVEEDPSTPGH